VGRSTVGRSTSLVMMTCNWVCQWTSGLVLVVAGHWHPLWQRRHCLRLFISCEMHQPICIFALSARARALCYCGHGKSSITYFQLLGQYRRSTREGVSTGMIASEETEKRGGGHPTPTV
jgi:hypothetical protein